MANSNDDSLGVCDYCGDDIDDTQECNLLSCTFQLCQDSAYHQDCLYAFLRANKLERNRKTGFKCPRGCGKGTKYPAPCPGRIDKSHPYYPRNEEKFKKRQAAPPPPAPPPAKPKVDKAAEKAAARQRAEEEKAAARAAREEAAAKAAKAQAAANAPVSARALASQLGVKAAKQDKDKGPDMQQAALLKAAALREISARQGGGAAATQANDTPVRDRPEPAGASRVSAGGGAPGPSAWGGASKPGGSPADPDTAATAAGGPVQLSLEKLIHSTGLNIVVKKAVLKGAGGTAAVTTAANGNHAHQAHVSREAAAVQSGGGDAAAATAHGREPVGGRPPHQHMASLELLSDDQFPPVALTAAASLPAPGTAAAAALLGKPPLPPTSTAAPSATALWQGPVQAVGAVPPGLGLRRSESDSGSAVGTLAPSQEPPQPLTAPPVAWAAAALAMPGGAAVAAAGGSQGSPPPPPAGALQGSDGAGEFALDEDDEGGPGGGGSGKAAAAAAAAAAGLSKAQRKNLKRAERKRRQGSLLPGEVADAAAGGGGSDAASGPSETDFLGAAPSLAASSLGGAVAAGAAGQRERAPGEAHDLAGEPSPAGDIAAAAAAAAAVEAAAAVGGPGAGEEGPHAAPPPPLSSASGPSEAYLQELCVDAMVARKCTRAYLQLRQLGFEPAQAALAVRAHGASASAALAWLLERQGCSVAQLSAAAEQLPLPEVEVADELQALASAQAWLQVPLDTVHQAVIDSSGDVQGAIQALCSQLQGSSLSTLPPSSSSHHAGADGLIRTSNGGTGHHHHALGALGSPVQPALALPLQVQQQRSALLQLVAAQLPDAGGGSASAVASLEGVAAAALCSPTHPHLGFPASSQQQQGLVGSVSETPASWRLSSSGNGNHAGAGTSGSLLLSSFATGGGGGAGAFSAEGVLSLSAVSNVDGLSNPLGFANAGGNGAQQQQVSLRGAKVDWPASGTGSWASGTDLLNAGKGGLGLFRPNLIQQPLQQQQQQLAGGPSLLQQLLMPQQQQPLAGLQSPVGSGWGGAAAAGGQAAGSGVPGQQQGGMSREQSSDDAEVNALMALMCR